MIKPLALVFYERLMPGSQLVNRLQDLGYRVLSLSDLERLGPSAQRESPLLLILDLKCAGDACAAIASLRAAPATAHLPVIGFAPDGDLAVLEAARTAGATVAVTEAAITNHLAPLIDQALHLD